MNTFRTTKKSPSKMYQCRRIRLLYRMEKSVSFLLKVSDGNCNSNGSSKISTWKDFSLPASGFEQSNETELNNVSPTLVPRVLRCSSSRTNYLSFMATLFVANVDTRTNDGAILVGDIACACHISKLTAKTPVTRAALSLTLGCWLRTRNLDRNDRGRWFHRGNRSWG